MKKLHLFNNLDRDIFFLPIIKNQLGRPDIFDRAKCFVWEYRRTLCLTQPTLLKAVEARKRLSPFIKKIEDKFDSEIRDGNYENFLKAFKLLDEIEETRELIQIADFGNENLCDLDDFFPELIESFPQKSYMEIDFDVRDDWVCPLREIEYQNVTRKYPMQLFRNADELIQGKDMNSKLNELVMSLVTQKEPSDRREKDLRDRVIVSSKVKLELYIDPDWSVGALQNILRTNVGHIHKLAKSLKKEKGEQGIKFTDPKEFDEKRLIRTIEVNLSYLGYYRLLECEKMEWADVNSIFLEKFKSNSDRRVIPKSYEQYRYNVAKYLPGLKHSKYHS